MGFQKPAKKRRPRWERRWDGSKILKPEAGLAYALKDSYIRQSVVKAVRHGGFRWLRFPRILIPKGFFCGLFSGISDLQRLGLETFL